MEVIIGNMKNMTERNQVTVRLRTKDVFSITNWRTPLLLLSLSLQLFSPSMGHCVQASVNKTNMTNRCTVFASLTHLLKSLAFLCCAPIIDDLPG